MLRMHFVQHCFNLADEASEEVLLDSTALRRFVGTALTASMRSCNCCTGRN